MDDTNTDPEDIIFLDIDGVLNTNESLDKNIAILPEKVAMLQNIASRTSASIIVSSDWKHSFTLNEITKILYCAGLVNVGVIGFTADDKHMDSIRGENIEGTLQSKIYGNYVILDDLGRHNFYDYQLSNLVQTDPSLGLTYMDVENAIGILRGRKNVLLSEE